MTNMKDKIFFIAISIAIFGTCCSEFFPYPDLFYPEQVHIAYGDEPSQMVISWVTKEPTNSSLVEYGTKDLDTLAKGEQTVFITHGNHPRHLYMHRVILGSLIPERKYYYHCGGVTGYSPLFFFTTRSISPKWSPRICIYGDLGSHNPRAIPLLQKWAQTEKFDAVLHIGDFAYNLDTNDGLMGDEFMRQIEPIAAYAPYMVSPGNHEQNHNYTHYKSRFRMPVNGDGESMYYSYDMGPVHIISFNSEVYYYYDDPSHFNANTMYEWLERDLEIANRPVNRGVQPWIVAVAHKPMYCSNSDDPTICSNIKNPVRVGFPGKSIEDLFCKYGVDIYFAGHEHSYERILPIYNFKIRNGSSSEPYTNPKATVHIVTGSAGNQEYQDPFLKLNYPFSAFHSDDYGFTMMYPKNFTHINIQQISDDKGGKIIDDVWIIKDTIGAPKFNCKK